MTTSRRELLQLTSAGLGSLALLGLGANRVTGSGGQPRDAGSGKDKKDKLVPGITIDNIYSGMTLGTSFTVVGSYVADGSVDPAITCVIQSANGSVGYADHRWQADFAGVTPGDSRTITATLKGATQNYTATVIDMTVLANPGGLTIDTINMLAAKPGKAANKSKVGFTPTAKGKVDDYEAMFVTYYSKGTETGERSPVSVKNNKWKQIHKFDQAHDTGKAVSVVVTALVWEMGRNAPRLIQVSQSDLQVGN
jgi:hypothetical protein